MTDNHEEFTPSLESQLAAELRDLLSGVPVGAEFDVAPSADLCFSLELFVPRLLCGTYPEWARESLDGFFVAVARKIRPRAARLVGTSILITDQTVTPFMFELEVSPTGDSITSFRVSIGEPGGGALGISGPECNSRQAKNLLAGIAERVDSVDWSFAITSDDRPTEPRRVG